MDKALAIPHQLTSQTIYEGNFDATESHGLFELLNNGGAFRSVVQKMSEEAEEVLENRCLSAGFAAI